jgi:alpha/beta superfamily hydrolase
VHRSLRRLAAAAALGGVPSLRFDYFGTGDSAGTDEEHDHPTSWIRSVHAAIDTLRERTGVDKVCVLGMRVGALPAAMAAQSRNDVSAFVALLPFVRGRTFVREALLRRASVAGTDTEVGDIEFAGHVVTHRARNELAELDLLQLPKPLAPRVLVARREDARDADKWIDRLTLQGARVETLIAEEPTRGAVDEDMPSAVSQSLIEQTAAWVCALGAAAGLKASPLATPEEHARTLHFAGVRETPVTIATEEAALFAILSESERRPSRRAVILLNTGLARRIGPARVYVTWARRWAREGTAVLRLDLPGLGDSDVQPGRLENEAYAIETKSAVEAAVTFLRQRLGNVDCRLMGICSGAFHALQAAVEGVPVQSVVLINQAAYFQDLDSYRAVNAWRLAWVINKQRHQTHRRPIARPPSLVIAHSLRRLKWRAVGWGIAGMNVVRDVARALHMPLPDDVGLQLRSLAQRRVMIHFVFSDDDRGLALLQLHGGRSVPTLEARGQLHVDVVEDADHIFTSRHARARAGDALTRIVHGKRLGSAGLREESSTAPPPLSIPAGPFG